VRRLALISLLFAMLAPVAPARAHETPAPGSHGPDPAAIDGAASGPRAAAATVSWCGEERSSDDTQHEVANGDFRYHAVYAVPADGQARLRSEAGRIQSDTMGASALLERLYGRAIRYDLGTSCGPQYLDISTVRLPQTRAELEQLADSPTGTLDAVANALDAAGFPVIKPQDGARTVAARTRNWVVWLDGPGPPGACGQAMLYTDSMRDQSNLNNAAGKVAVVFRGEDGVFCGANSVRHEIAHNLGAVLGGAPHEDGGHCTDAIEDTMCVPGSPRKASGAYHELFFDYGNDDYWDPPAGPALPWWTVNLSRFVCPDAGCNGAARALAETDASVADSEPAARTRPRVRLVARRSGRRWRVVLHARGSGTAVVSLRCRRRPGQRVVTAWRKRASLPRTLRSQVSCASRPQAVVVADRAR
jgi:hypothetical protein